MYFPARGEPLGSRRGKELLCDARAGSLRLQKNDFPSKTTIATGTCPMLPYSPDAVATRIYVCTYIHTYAISILVWSPHAPARVLCYYPTFVPSAPVWQGPENWKLIYSHLPRARPVGKLCWLWLPLTPSSLFLQPRGCVVLLPTGQFPPRTLFLVVILSS